MTPAARAQAAVEILDQVIAAARDDGAAADTLIARYFHDRRYAGSKDRRAVRDLVYRAIRRAGARPASGRAAMVGLAREDAEVAVLFDGTAHGPAPITAEEPGARPSLAPTWLMKRLVPAVGKAELRAMAERAPLDLRANTLKTSRADLAAMIPGAHPTDRAATGLRLEEGAAVESLPAFAEGLFEVQDEGSQLIVAATGARPGMTVIDLCAGAGGKTLALAAEMANDGQLIASDTDRRRLSRLGPRAERAGARNITSVLLDPGRELAALDAWVGQADIVLIDAPCSGTGTWRRNPEARWRLNPERMARLGLVQSRLLDIGAALVRPGGRLVYAVCSLLDEEGADRFADFLTRQPDWRALPLLPGTPRAGAGVRLSPLATETDGFFIAGAEKP